MAKCFAILALALIARSAVAIDDGLARTPPMGSNSWTAVGTGVSADFLLKVGQFFVSSGLAAKVRGGLPCASLLIAWPLATHRVRRHHPALCPSQGYTFVNSDDGWSTTRINGTITPDPSKFPSGISGLTSSLKQLGLSFGIYTAESSVVCSGRPGTLFNEYHDAQVFAEWGVALVKNDNCE